MKKGRTLLCETLLCGTLLASSGLSLGLTQQDEPANIRLSFSVYSLAFETTNKTPSGGSQSSNKTTSYGSFSDAWQIKIDRDKWSLSVYPGSSGAAFELGRFIIPKFELGMQLAFAQSKADPKNVNVISTSFGPTGRYYQPVGRHMLEPWLGLLVKNYQETRTTAGIDTNQSKSETNLSLGLDFAFVVARNFHTTHGFSYCRVSGNENETPKASYSSSAFTLTLAGLRLFI